MQRTRAAYGQDTCALVHVGLPQLAHPLCQPDAVRVQHSQGGGADNGGRAGQAATCGSQGRGTQQAA